MIQKLMETSLYFINSRNITEIILKKKDWIIADSLSPEFFEKLKENQYKVAFIKEENIFSHGMNVLRNILFNTKIIAVIGINEIYKIIQNAEECSIRVKANLIIIDDLEYKFRDFSFLRDTSEIIEYNLDTKEICYKPDYYYNSELSKIIIEGYNIMNTILPSWHSSRCDNEGRIWSKGFCFPHQFFEYFSVNTQKYYANLLNYIDILEKIFSLRYLLKETEELKQLLLCHYSYSTIFSFITPNISEKLTEHLSNEEIEKVYDFFVINSPIHNKENLTDISLEKMRIFLANILDNVDNDENYRNVYAIEDVPINDMALMYFVTNMICDIRRCVINIIIEHNDWFSSICKHRKKVKIY